MSNSFAEILEPYMKAKNVGNGKLSKQVHALDDSLFIPPTTIRNWRTGRAKSARDWRHIVAIAYLLDMRQECIETILQLSGHPDLAILSQMAESPFSDMLVRWMPNIKQKPAPSSAKPTLKPVTSFRSSSMDMTQVYDVAHMKGWARADYTTGANGKPTLITNCNQYHFSQTFSTEVNSFSVEWAVSIVGRASIFVVGLPHKHYWMSFHPDEKRIRLMTVVNEQYTNYGKIYFSTLHHAVPNTLIFERIGDMFNININDEPVALPSGTHTVHDFLFEGKKMPLHVGFGGGVNANETTKVCLEALNVYRLA